MSEAIEFCITAARFAGALRNLNGESAEDAEKFLEMADKATKELAEYNRKLSVIMCAYCGHESPKSEQMAVIEHTMTCEKRPEKRLLEKAFEIEDRLYEKIIHLTFQGYNPGDCETCTEIQELLRVYEDGTERQA